MAHRLLLKHKKQFKVKSVKRAENFINAFMDSGHEDRGLRIRFVPMPEKRGIELQSHNSISLRTVENALRRAGHITKELSFEINKIVKLLHGRRDTRLDKA